MKPARTTLCCLPLLALLLAQPRPPAAPQEDDPPPEQGQQAAEGEENAEELAAALKLQQEYFDICDFNENGWISFKEATRSLGLDRDAYRSYDADRDGRVTFEEFSARYQAIMERIGTFRTPEAMVELSLIPSRNAEQLRNAYDRNGDIALDIHELIKIARDYGRTDVPADIVLEMLDHDRSGKLEADEIDQLAQLIGGTYLGTREDEETEEEAEEVEPVVASSIEELFGEVIPRPGGFNSLPQPPQIVGPIFHFRRLDLDGDGRITASDLARLQAPIQLPIRVSTVISVMDINGDAAVDELEFYASLQEIP